MSVTTDDDLFVLRTHAQLAALKAQADLIRRSLAERHFCPDEAPCRHCSGLLVIHERIDDYVTQLEDAHLLVTP